MLKGMDMKSLLLYQVHKFPKIGQKTQAGVLQSAEAATSQTPCRPHPNTLCLLTVHIQLLANADGLDC